MLSQKRAIPGVGPAAIVLAGLLCGRGVAAGQDLPSFQALIDTAEPNAVLTPESGVYRGPVRIDKPLVVDGRGKVTIDAGGKGSVVVLDTDGATLKGLHLTNSGNSHNDWT